MLQSYSVCQTEDFYLPSESELSISIGITIDFHVEGLFSTGLYLPHLFLNNKFCAEQDLCGAWCLRGLVKLVREAESAIRQGMLEVMLSALLPKAVQIKAALAVPFSACHEFATPAYQSE